MNRAVEFIAEAVWTVIEAATISGFLFVGLGGVYLWLHP